MSTERFTLKQFLLGMQPYVVIEVGKASDGSGEPSLFVEAGGRAEEDPSALPLLVLTERPADDANHIATMLREVRGKCPTAVEPSASYWRDAVDAVVKQFNPAWLPYVRGEVAE